LAGPVFRITGAAADAASRLLREIFIRPPHQIRYLSRVFAPNFRTRTPSVNICLTI
jgi:hypothetical protein